MFETQLNLFGLCGETLPGETSVKTQIPPLPLQTTTHNGQVHQGW
jgi:hypothetical protein